MSDIYLFGHSFIDHLRRYVLKDGSRDILGLDPIEFKVHFHGHGGLSLLQQQRLRSVEGRVRGASMVFLEIGTNDLADQECDPLRLARDICLCAEYLRVGFDVQMVVISQIIFRDVVPYDTFNQNVVTANSAIKSRVDSLENIYFWRHRGLWNPELPILDHSGRYPGVHLNDEGHRKYLRSIRDCIIRVSKW